MRKSLFVLLTGVLTSCGSVNYFQIETYNPSEVTFPNTVNEILVVNHSVPSRRMPVIGLKYWVRRRRPCMPRRIARFMTLAVRWARR